MVYLSIRYRFDVKQAKSKAQTEVLDEFLLADDMAGVLKQKRRCNKNVKR